MLLGCLFALAKPRGCYGACARSVYIADDAIYILPATWPDFKVHATGRIDPGQQPVFGYCALAQRCQVIGNGLIQEEERLRRATRQILPRKLCTRLLSYGPNDCLGSPISNHLAGDKETIAVEFVQDCGGWAPFLRAFGGFTDAPPDAARNRIFYFYTVRLASLAKSTKDMFAIMQLSVDHLA